MEQNRELVVPERQDDMVPSFAVSMVEAQKRFTELQRFIQAQMVEGEDYGNIPGCKKPSLFKPGAEKLCSIYGFSPRFKMDDSVKDWERGFFHYQIKSELVSKRTGIVIAEGVGSCNSKEKKWISQDGYSINNTILKMAKKRALVDAVLTATRTSGLFTQDIEDGGIIDSATVSQSTPATPQHARKVQNDGPSSEKQQKAIYAISKKAGMEDSDLKGLLFEEAGVEHTRDLTVAEASTIIDKLQALKP